MKEVFQNLPAGGFIVIVIIAALFALALVLLFHLSARYRYLVAKTAGKPERGFHAALQDE